VPASVPPFQRSPYLGPSSLRQQQLGPLLLMRPGFKCARSCTDLLHGRYTQKEFINCARFSHPRGRTVRSLANNAIAFLHHPYSRRPPSWPPFLLWPVVMLTQNFRKSYPSTDRIESFAATDRVHGVHPLHRACSMVLRVYGTGTVRVRIRGVRVYGTVRGSLEPVLSVPTLIPLGVLFFIELPSICR
jgi:hypothetical protein